MHSISYSSVSLALSLEEKRTVGAIQLADACDFGESLRRCWQLHRHLVPLTYKNGVAV